MKSKLGLLVALVLGLALGLAVDQALDRNNGAKRTETVGTVAPAPVPESEGAGAASKGIPSPLDATPETIVAQATEAIRIETTEVAVAPSPTSIPPATFTIESFRSLPEQKAVLITFSDTVDLETLREQAVIEPNIYLYWYSSSVSGNVLNLKGTFNYNTDYTLSFPDSLASTNQSLYRQTLGSFHMPDRPPTIKYSEDKPLIERNSRQMVHLDVLNIAEIAFEGIQVPPLLLPLARAYVDGASLESLKEPADEITRLYTEVAQALSASEEWKPFLREPAFDKSLFFSPTKTNITQPFSIPLTFRKEPEKGALELLHFKNNVAGASGHSDLRLYRISDLGLTYKISDNQLLAWVTSLEKAQPLTGVSLLGFDKEGSAYLLGQTTESGVLIADGTSVSYPKLALDSNGKPTLSQSPLPYRNLIALVAATLDDANFLDLDPKDCIKVTGIDQVAARNAAIDTDRGYLFTERGVYRPGESVHWKATVRDYRDGEIGVPEDSQFSVKIIDSKENLVLDEQHSLSEFGTIQGELVLEGFAPLGTYILSLRSSSSEQPIAERTFEVQEYRPPRHYVEVQFRRETRIAEEFINRHIEQEMLVATITGRYYAGGPLKNAKVRWRVLSTPSEFPQENYSGFHFGYPTDREGEFIETSETMLDASGQAEIRIPLGESLLSSKHGLSLTATVVDFDGRTATRNADYSVTPTHLVGLSSPPADIKFGDPQVLRAIVLDASRIAIPTGELVIRVMEKSYLYTRKRNDEGNSYISWDSVWREQYKNKIEIEGGEGAFEFRFNQSGDYLVEATYTDETGRKFTSANLYEVKGPWYWGDQEKTLAYQPVQVLPDKAEYAVGETIRLLVNSAEKPSACLLSIEREGVIEHRMVETERGEILLPVTEDFRPNVFISLLGVVPRGSFPTYEEEYDSESPAFVYGTVGVKVRNEVGALEIAIAPEEKKIQAQPGDTLEVELAVADESGNPVVAELAVAVVDEQVLALTGYSTPSLKSLLDFKLPLAVFTGEARLFLQNQTPYEPILNQPITGGDGALLGYGIGIQIREDFNPVAFFDPAIVTDASGQASFSFEFPDTMTTYRIYAVACDRGSRFGNAQKPARVVKNFYIEPGAPRFFTRGDRFQFNLSLFNHTVEEGTVQLEIESSENLDLELGEMLPHLGANDQIQVPVRGTALSSGMAAVTLAGRFGNETDAVRIELPVESGLILHQDIQSGTFTELAEIEYTFPAETASVPWEEFSADDLKGRLTLSGSPFLKIAPGLRYLLEYPYGCIEQTSSRVLPLAALRSVIEKGLVPGFTVEEVDPYLRSGVERILSMQTDSGGFAYWPDLNTPDAWGSLYAVGALVAAGDSGFEVPQDSLDLALTYLEGRTGSEAYDDRADLSFEAMADYLIAKAKSLPSPPEQQFEQTYETLDRESRFFALMTAKLIDLLPLENLRTSLALLLPQTQSQPTDLAFNPVYREKAVALLAGQMLGAEEGVRRGLADELLAGMKSSGRWTSTSDTGWSLLALGEYFSDWTSPEPSVQGSVTVASAEPIRFDFQPASWETFPLDAQALAKDPNIRIDTGSAIPLTYQLELSYPRMDLAEKGYSNGFTLTKTIENTGNSDTIRVGDVVKVTLSFQGTKEYGEYHHVVLDDPLPAGLVAINSALATEEPVENPDESRYWQEGHYSFIPNHSEMRDTRVVAFRDRIWSGPYRYTYYARAVCEGEFRVPSTKVQLMYSPDVCAYSPESSLTIAAQ